MVNSSRVAEFDGGDKLLEVAAADVFFQSAFGDLLEEFAAADVLHDEVDFGFGGHDLVELDDVWMADAAED